jgi:hypothetical protein
LGKEEVGPVPLSTPEMALRVLGVIADGAAAALPFRMAKKEAAVPGDGGKPPTRGVSPVPGVRPVRGVKPVRGVRPVRKVVGSKPR